MSEQHSQYRRSLPDVHELPHDAPQLGDWGGLAEGYSRTVQYKLGQRRQGQSFGIMAAGAIQADRSQFIRVSFG
jgi:hypothetical protein